MSERLAAEPVLAAAAELGECPVWDRERELLHWVDAVRGELHSTSPASGADTVLRLGRRLGSIAPRAGGGLLGAVDDEVILLDPENRVERVTAGPWRGPGSLVNDGACDSAGRFWVGSVRADPDAGALFCLEPDGSARTALAGIGESNGIGWSPGGEWLYHVDSRRGTVEAHAFTPATGTLGEHRRLLDVPAGEGLPDGLAVDEEGGVWVAIWGLGEVRRYSAAGVPLAVVELPVSHVTSCCFGGADLDQLWITTARGELSPAELAREPLAGALFRADPGVTGLPAGCFGS